MNARSGIGEIGFEDLCGAPQVARSSGSILGALGTLDQEAGQILPALLAHVAMLEPMELIGPSCVLWHVIIERVAAHVASLRNATKRNRAIVATDYSCRWARSNTVLGTKACDYPTVSQSRAI